MSISAVISDFGGVLTTPLLKSFVAFQNETGVPFEALGRAMQRIADADPEGKHPLHELEKGHMTEPAFLELMADNLEPELGHRPEMHRFSEIYFRALEPNEPMVALMRDLRGRGLRMALLTNNVREWEPYWRKMLPVDEIFDVIVDSGFVGMRKPEPGIYELTLERLGDVRAEDCLFVDDFEENCATATSLGMTTVHYREPEQAAAEIEAALSAG